LHIQRLFTALILCRIAPAATGGLLLHIKSVVCVYVCFYTDMSRAKTAEPIQMPFGVLALVGLRNHCIL